MGNHQSTANPNRLSKPKTNTNSPSQSFKVDSPVSVSSRYADLSVKDRHQIRETLLSPADTEFGSRIAAAFRSNKNDGIDETATNTRGRPLSVISRSNSRTNSRSNSLSCFGSKHGSSTRLAGLSDSKVSLASPAPVDLEATIRVLQEVKRYGSPEDLAALHEALAPLDTHTVPVEEHGLGRRNSVMNRSSSSLTRRRSLIQTPGMATRNSSVDGRRSTWNSWKTPKIEPAEEARWRSNSKAAFPLNRLAAAKDSGDTPTPRAQTPSEMDYSHLGSLKLGSLVVTNGAPSPAPSAKFSKQSSRLAGQDDYFSAVEADSSPLMMKTTRRRGHVKSKSSVLPTTVPLHNNQPSDIRPGTGTAKALRITNNSVDTLAHDANRLAQSYQAEIPTSPFGKQAEDHRMDQDEGFVSGSPTFGEEGVGMLDSTIIGKPTSTVEVSDPVTSSKTPHVLAPAQQRPRAPQRPPPRTSDSGYSSGGSLRLVNREQHKDALPKSKQRSDSPLKGDSAKVEQPETSDMSQAVTSEQPLSPTIQTSQARRRPLSLKILNHSARSSVRSSASESILSPQTPQSITSKTSFDSTSSTSHKRSQRRGQSHAEPPVVQSCQPIPEGTIPDVPDNVRAKFVRRLSHTPGMECLTHTYPTKDHILANEPASDGPFTVSTIHNQLAELEPDRPPTPPAHGRRMSFSMFRRKSTVEDKEVEGEADDSSLGVVDLGTIASALGSSPYDAAMSGLQRNPTTARTHPHQLGKALPRAKSMVNMDSEAAAEFARLRSKDRASVPQELSQQRRRSYHNLKMDAGEAKASKRRPQSFDIPPVPAINASRLSPPQCARPRLEKGGQEQEETKPDMSSSAQSRERGQIVPQVVEKCDDDRPRSSQHEVDWEAHAQTWRQRRKSIGEGLRAKAAPTTEDMASWGRYSGGLSYGYEGRGVGIGGSAGTRSQHSAASNKSLPWRHQYGVDLSDVPVMLQRV
ncbi:uncharacterized protein K460DRAFT_366618 [Cucurbitaria berberidis CBS 394.84]|uniref:Uncharacterized protein n=1 Tax=Cucurbitaria berberidis CBS 394.84 TaxID=1168544 RepID=A0A9P4GIC6_9PLEO|nr:uncharacterized protein K460DRAFT_366618 [Cucurbitaria berberidis CBS 394.84]KAF1845769.1 hypothetical protein K460DRAFT_366618 [Cucurbitaria berberidis CBS 394.84]